MNNKSWDSLWVNGQAATMVASRQSASGFVTNAALAIKDGRIAFIGPMADLEGAPEHLADEVHDMQGRCLTPGFIDCHTHVVYAGNRNAEWKLRLEGKSYAEIAQSGGGIWATVTATRAASEETLLQQSLQRVRDLMASGVTTIEIKSGYGLDLETELKILRTAKKIGEQLNVRVVTTFLGAHALPFEFKGRPDDYIDWVSETVLPKVVAEGLADSVDVFCETIAFDLKQTERVFASAKKLGLSVKCHAEQLSNCNASVLAAKYQALSVDHLECLSEEGVRAIAASGTVAVLLPGAYYFLGEKQLPPVHLLRHYQVPMAIASDCNPGTSPVTSLLFILNSACVLFGLTPEEALAGVTRHAAIALGLGASLGTLEVGKLADFLIWDVQRPEELIYQVGSNLLHKAYRSPIIPAQGRE